MEKITKQGTISGEKRSIWKTILLWIIEIWAVLILADAVIGLFMFITVGVQIEAGQILGWIIALYVIKRNKIIIYKKQENFVFSHPKEPKPSQKTIRYKLFLPVSILLSSIVLGGFYYASETNKLQSIKAEKERAILIECGNKAKQNQKVYQDEWNKTHNAIGYSRFSETTIHFNKELNLCVYEGGIADDTRWEIHIFNAYTNEILTSFVKFDEDEWDDYYNKWYNNFNKKKAYYFEEK